MRLNWLAFVIGLCLTSSPAHAQESGQAGVAKEARAILKVTCHRCHGEDGTVEGGFSYVLDRQQLVSRKQIVPSASAKSRLIRRIQSGEMPPEGETPTLTKEQIATLVKWVEAGAPDFDQPRRARKFIAATDMIDTMAADLAQRAEPDRQFTRYLTLTHLYNAGRSDDELQSYNHGITKLVNSLSWGRRVVAPVLLGSPPTILRIDIRDYKWSEAVWEKLALADPYGLTYSSSSRAKELYQQTGSPLPYIRGDWFVAAAARPPLYHEILQLPHTEKELEVLLHVDVAENIRTAQTARAGFNGSAVSRNNRMIERHDSSYGYYWKSYDFAKNIDRQNLFSHPLGPGTTEKLFKHDGGELIFSLPNGFQGYLLVDGAGRRIDKGPTEIVSDPRQPDRAVENGLSCMTCHVRGMLPKDDQIRAHAEKNPGSFTKKELESILALYPTQERFQKLIEEDTEKFRKATEQAGMPPALTEPIRALATLFETELDLPLAAAEASMTPDDLQKLLAKTPALARVLGSLQTTGGSVQRETFANSFAALARAAKIGSPRMKSTVVVRVETDTPSPMPTTEKGLEPKMEPEPKNSDEWVLLGGRNKFPATFQPNQQAVSNKAGLSMNGRHYLLTRKGDYLSRDFKFELVFTMKEDTGNGIMFLGLGEADRNSAYNEPKNSVFLRIHPPNVDNGSISITNHTGGGVAGLGKVTRAGTHRATIEKVGDTVTFAIDVDNDGPSDDDLENTIPDIKAFGTFLHNKNTFVFFGGGGTYQKLRFSTPNTTGEEMASVPVDKPAEDSPAAEPLEPEKSTNKLTPLGKGRALPAPWVSRTPFKSEREGGIRIPNHQLVLSKDGTYLKKDFTYEIVITLKEGDDIALMGIGNTTNNVPHNFNECITMRIHPPKLSNGEVLTAARGDSTINKTCTLSRPGTHLFRIIKKGSAVTFVVDADNDGESDDDGEFTIPDIKEFAPYLHDKNTYLFFGNGGLYKSTRVTIDK